MTKRPKRAVIMAVIGTLGGVGLGGVGLASATSQSSAIQRASSPACRHPPPRRRFSLSCPRSVSLREMFFDSNASASRENTLDAHARRKATHRSQRDKPVAKEKQDMPHKIAKSPRKKPKQKISKMAKNAILQKQTHE